MWHVSSRSGVATLRTAIHLLLTYLLTLVTLRLTGDHRQRRRVSVCAGATAPPHRCGSLALGVSAYWQGRIKHLVRPTHFTMPGALRTSVSCLPVNAALPIGHYRRSM